MSGGAGGSFRSWSWALLVIASGLYFLSGNEADNDLWVHVRVGLDVLAAGPPRIDAYSYTALGGAWTDHEWLLHALFGALYRAGGDRALLAFKLAVGAGTLGLLAAAVARRTESAAVRGVVLVLALSVLARGFAVRPQVLTYLFAAGLWLFLDSPRRRDASWRWLLVPAFALWANLHAGVLLGLGMAALCAGWRIALGTPRRSGVALASAAVLGGLAALVFNPYGLGYAAYVWRELGYEHPITEWQAVAVEPAQATFLLLAAAFALSLPFLRRWRERGWAAALAAAILVAAMLQQRHTPVFALFAAPLVAEGLDGIGRRLGLRLSPPAQTILAAAVVALAVVQIGVTLQRFGRDGFAIVFAAEDYPVEAVRRLASAPAGVNVAVPLEWGGYALWHLGPERRVSLDGRFATVYPPDVVEDNFAFFAGRDDWKRLLDAYPTDAVLAPAAAPPPIAAAAGWQRAFADDVAVLFVRRGGVLGGAIDAPGAPADGSTGLRLRFP